jgi:hypothetical protein
MLPHHSATNEDMLAVTEDIHPLNHTRVKGTVTRASPVRFVQQQRIELGICYMNVAARRTHYVGYHMGQVRMVAYTLKPLCRSSHTHVKMKIQKKYCYQAAITYVAIT